MELKKKSPDFLIFLTVLLLSSVGVVMVFSSSAYTSYHSYNQDSFVYLRKQLFNLGLSVFAMVFVMRIKYQKLKTYAKPALIVSFLALAALLIKGVGIEVNGSVRWIGAGPLRFQPSELIKLAMIIYLALYLSEKQERVKSLTEGFLIPIGLMGAACILIMLQPDLGTAMALAGTTYVMLWSAGARKTHLGILALLGVGLIIAAIIFEPYRMARITAYLHPWDDPLDSGFQTVQSLMAIGSGGLTGRGLGMGGAKLYYLPEEHTDFIFATLSEELGFIGGALVILLYLFFVIRGLKVAIASPDCFGSLVAVGVTSMVGIQAIMNIGVVTGTLPVTGITLPFISYGGSSLIFSLMGIGLLLNVSRYAGLER